MSAPSQAPQIFLVDDDEVLRDSLRFLLESAGYRIETCATAEDFLAECQPRPGSCVILDVRMPGMSGLELQRELARRGSRVPVIFLTGHGDVPMAVDAVKRGAFDFVEKPVRDVELLRVIAAALEVEAAARDQQARQRTAAARLEALTQRERQVLDRVVAGRPNKRIAQELGISVKTVEAHRARLMARLRVGSSAELVRLVVESRQP